MGAIREVSGSPPIRGAARSLDVTMFPSNLQNNTTVTADGRTLNRQGVYVSTDGTFTGIGVPPAGGGYNTYRGRLSYRNTGNGVSGGFWGTQTIWIQFPQNKLQTATIGDFNCWRITAILAMDSSGLGSGDIGLEVGAFGSYNMISAGVNPGFSLRPTSATNVQLQIRQNGGGALTVDQSVADFTASGSTCDDWHMYEMRFIGATNGRDAIFRALVDGVLKASFSWGAGTLMPAFGNGSNLGYQVMVGNRGATSTWIAMNGISIQAAPTESALL